MKTDRSWSVMNKSAKQIQKWQNGVKPCSDLRCFQLHHITGKVVMPELQYRAHPSSDQQHESFSVMIACFYLLDGLLYQLTNIKTCVRSVLKQIVMPKKPR